MLDYRYMTVDGLEDPIVYKRELERLPWNERKEKAEQYKFDKDKRLCVVAGILAMDLIRSHGISDYTLDYNEYGKPFLKNVPGIYFNLSHSGDMVVCAISDKEVGVDVEEIQGCDLKVADLCLKEDEYEWLMSQDDRNRAFISLWVKKESYLKAKGKGFSIDPKSFSVFDIGRGSEWSFIEEEINGKIISICHRIN